MRPLELGTSNERGKAEIRVQLHLTRHDASVAARNTRKHLLLSSYRDLSSMNHFVDVRINMYFVAKEWARVQTVFIAEYFNKLYRVI